VALADSIMDLVEGAMGSPWVYLALLAFAAIDAFFPIVPSETLVISAGVFAASDGEPVVVGIVAAAAMGAFIGDHISYLIGRTAGRRLKERATPGSRRERSFAFGQRLLEERGGPILIVCRYIPGARTAVTLSAGAVGYALRRFSFFDAIAALTWAGYSTFVGYIGGEAFEDDPWKGLGLGLGIALAVSALIELVRHLRRPKAVT
jgi:membrane protein DedA with SNARE-associated domain